MGDLRDVVAGDQILAEEESETEGIGEPTK